MSTGKYSPICPHANQDYDFCFNAYGQPVAPYNKDSYDAKTMFGNYDDEGFDSYGYSAFDLDGNYVGIGNGIDRYGYTESDYLVDAINGGDLYDDYGHVILTQFNRK